MEEFILMKNHSAAQNVNKFSPSQHLKTHKRIHTKKNIQLFKFSDRSAWKRHEIIHTDEKPFSCSKWEKKFLDRSAWKIHEKIYTERKLFSCSTQPITAFEDT